MNINDEDSSDVSREYKVVDCESEGDGPDIKSADVLNLDQYEDVEDNMKEGAKPGDPDFDVGENIGKLFGTVIWQMVPSSTLGKMALFFILSAIGISGFAIVSVVGIFGLGFYIVKKVLSIFTCGAIGGPGTTIQ